MELTLTATKKIIEAINSYSGKSMDFDRIMKHVASRTRASQGEVAQVIEFLQELQISSPATPNITLASRIDMSEEISLHDELSYNYKVAKAILQEILEQEVPDKEELRKTLTTIQKFMDSMLKMQEKVYNVQQIQRFQEAVMEILQKHQLKEIVVRQLLELPL